MDKTTRYLILLLCVVLFVIIAPLIVLYVSGTRFSLSEQEYTPTGILVAKTAPSNANVLIDTEEKDTTPATIRFLDQGEYLITLQKPTYFDWSKRLPVEPGKVTYTYEGVDAVEMLRIPEPVTVPAKDVTCLAAINQTIWFGSTNTLAFTTVSDPVRINRIPFPFTPRSITLLSGGEYLLVQNESNRKVIVDASSQALIALPDSFNSAVDLHISPSGTILARRGDTVYEYNPKNHITTPIIRNVVGFTLLEGIAYIAATGDTVTLQTMQWVNNAFSEAEPLFTDRLPQTDNVQLIVTRNKELFALSKNNLYRINAQFELVSTQVLTATLDPRTHELTFQTPSELWFYNFLVNRPQLLTRTTTDVHTYLIRSSIGYGLLGTDQGLEALEIDSRDHQNRYQLLSGKPVWSVGVSDNREYVYALQDGQINIVRIR